MGPPRSAAARPPQGGGAVSSELEAGLPKLRIPGDDGTGTQGKDSTIPARGGRIARASCFAAQLVVAAIGIGCSGDRELTAPGPPPTGDGGLPPRRPDVPNRPPTHEYALTGFDCGAVVADHTGTVPQGPVDCLLNAVAAGKPAYLVVTTSTIEGDPVFSVYQVVGAQAVQNVLDARWDSYGSGELTRQRCSVVASGGTELVRGSDGRSIFLAECRQQ